MAGAPDSLTLHASTVALEGRAVVLFGPSGSGKSALALSLMAFGAKLVADDITCLTREGPTLVARCPEPGRGLIEARGVGILSAPALSCAPVHLAVDMGRAEVERLPPRRHVPWLGLRVPLILRGEHPHFAAFMLQRLMTGRQG